MSVTQSLLVYTNVSSISLIYSLANVDVFPAVALDLAGDKRGRRNSTDILAELPGSEGARSGGTLYLINFGNPAI